jgi:hypothetical protein
MLALVVTVGLGGCQKKTPGPSPEIPAGSTPVKGTLSFDDDGVSWITTGNYFAQRYRASAPKWFGVLFQFGAFSNSLFQGEVQFIAPNGNAVTTAPLTAEGKLAEAQFTWINIVSTRAGVDAPVMPGETLQLFPNTSSTSPCDMVNGNNCLRDRRIHWDQPHINFFITYWQGDHGYEVVSQLASDHPDRNTVEFRLPDNFVVDVYKLGASGDMNPVLHLDSGSVKSIHVRNTQEGTPHGGKHDPTWDIITPP